MALLAKVERVQRYPFVAALEITHLHSAAQLKAETSDLSLIGCNVKTAKVWTAGTMVRVSITEKRASFVAFGRVVYARPKIGMGIVFTQIEPIDQVVLQGWIAKLRVRQ